MRHWQLSRTQVRHVDRNTNASVAKGIFSARRVPKQDFVVTLFRTGLQCHFILGAARKLSRYEKLALQEFLVTSEKNYETKIRPFSKDQTHFEMKRILHRE